MNQMDRRFATALLRRIRAPVTKANLRFLVAWGQAEGTRARFNPLGTTRFMPGSTDFNSVGVRNFADFGSGVEGTARALENGLYNDLVRLMRSGRASPQAMGAAVAASRWGTGRGVLNVLGAGAVRVPPATPPVRGRAAGTARATLQTMEVPALTPQEKSAIYMNLLRSAESGNTVGMLEGLQSLRRTKLKFKTVQPVGPNPKTRVLPPELGETPETGPWQKWVSFASGADRPGAKTNPIVPQFVAKIAALYGKHLTIGTGTNHNQYVVGTQRQSDHWTGDAADIPMSGSALTRLGRIALIAAGANRKWAMKQTGGAFHINGYNILFNTYVGGNHYNHLHVGLGQRPHSYRRGR